jgi:hypothetical protein
LLTVAKAARYDSLGCSGRANLMVGRSALTF